MDDPRRAVPRTDSVLAEPVVAEAARRSRPGRRSRPVVTEVLRACREGEVAPADVLSEVVDRMPRAEHVAPAGPQRHRRRRPHQPRARAALEAAVDALALAAGDHGRRARPRHRPPRAAAGPRRARRAARRRARRRGRARREQRRRARVALAARALAADREVVVARGELVEIGDGFRIPELVESVGVRLREVGTTNRVRLEDYAAAVDDRTAFVLKVHPRNFRVEGFTSSVGVEELPRRSALPVVADIGSGPARAAPAAARRARRREHAARRRHARHGVRRQAARRPAVRASARPGERRARAAPAPDGAGVRVDKLTLAALEATLTGPPTPVAEALCAAGRRPDCVGAPARGASSVVTSASRPPTDGSAGEGRPGCPAAQRRRVASRPPSPNRCASVTPPVVGRVSGGRLLLDLLTVTGGRRGDAARGGAAGVARTGWSECTSSRPPATSTTASPPSCAP